MKKLLISLAAALLVILAAVLILPRGPEIAEPVDEHCGIPESWENTIAYVPLDDRPDNLENVILMAEASGWHIVIPEPRLFRTALDGQEPNPNGTQYGDREELLLWVRRMDELGCDLFLLSADQLLSGGLVNSRAMQDSLPLELPEGRLSEEDAFDAYIMALGDDPANRVYLFDSVARLASTVGYGGFGTEEYTALRAYGNVERPLLGYEELSLESVFAAYPFAADGITGAEAEVSDAEGPAVLTEELISAYLSARERKLSLTDHIISAVKGSENFRLLIGIDDSSSLPNIQRNELAYIEKCLGENAVLIAGLDSLARLMIASATQEEYGLGVKTCVEFIGGSQDIPASDYDLYTASQVAEKHMTLLSAESVPEAEAELQVLILTPPDDTLRSEEYFGAAVDRLCENAERHIPTVFIDASRNAYGEAFETALLENAELSRLMGFSGRYYQANVIGTGFAMGFSRYIYLRCGDTSEALPHVSQLKQLVYSAEMCYPFALHVREELNSYVTGLGLDPNNIICDDRTMQSILDKASELMDTYGSALRNNFEGSRLPCKAEPGSDAEIVTADIYELRLPWNRTFEISFRVSAGLGE
ncbi:MAG: DUF4127 family protein [Oscillospiraceae bacterium]|nr:DUF4127 family protein [Oscillospiraceae bacterium]